MIVNEFTIMTIQTYRYNTMKKDIYNVMMA